MSTVLDDLLVGLVLLASAAYVFSALGPRQLRRRVLAGLGGWLGRAPAAFRLRRVSQKISAAAQAKGAGACGGCDNCGTDTPSSGKTTEIKVPIANIGRTRTSRQG